MLSGALEKAEALTWRVGCWGRCAVRARTLLLLLLLRLWGGTLWCRLLALVVGVQLTSSFRNCGLCLALAHGIWIICPRRRSSTTNTCITGCWVRWAGCVALVAKFCSFERLIVLITIKGAMLACDEFPTILLIHGVGTDCTIRFALCGYVCRKI